MYVLFLCADASPWMLSSSRSSGRLLWSKMCNRVTFNKPGLKSYNTAHTAHTADMFDGFSYLTCKALMFYQRCMSSIANADRADSKAARLAPEACLMLFIFQRITYAEIVVKIDSDMKRYRATRAALHSVFQWYIMFFSEVSLARSRKGLQRGHTEMLTRPCILCSYRSWGFLVFWSQQSRCHICPHTNTGRCCCDTGLVWNSPPQCIEECRSLKTKVSKKWGFSWEYNTRIIWFLFSTVL